MTGIIIGDTTYNITNLVSIDDPGSEVSRPIKRATSSKSSKLRPQSKFYLILEHQSDWHTIPEEAKAPPRRTKKPRAGALVVDDSIIDTPTEKVSKRSVDASENRSSKFSTKKIIPNADDDTEDDAPLLKSEPKGKAVNKTKPKGKFLENLSPSSILKVFD